MNEALKKVDTYAAIFGQMKNRFRWRVSDSRILMMAASLYVTSERDFDLQRFDELSEFIKDEVGMFSTLKHQERFTIAAMLDTRFEAPKDKLHEFLSIYEDLKDTGFHRSVYTYIAAMVALSGEKHHKESVPLAFSIYKKMKEHHFFLTGQDDYPLAMLLAQGDQDTDELMDQIEGYYRKLNGAGFRKGNELQSMSHILSLQDEVAQDEMVNRCSQLFQIMKQGGMKAKAMHYPQIALLSFLEDAKARLAQLEEIWERLNSEKLFKWHKDINMLMAVQFLITEQIEHSSMLSTSLYTTMETLIQAQQAASVAAISGAAAAAAASN
ncbi:DUF4003 family protein [Falsibacillus albus]|uniref:DUF4003 domain-containing protein n=1 Tax=Falsibacillus albus TaxID=2478915 RepID=A0A3L7JSG6_9BACI|nr:DUF4003 family protein [Falsibacillus albus]RLQ93773.1 DUF4003 domain-containing protein [Falsibacillus albus]